MANFMIFLWHLVCFEILYQFSDICPQEDPLRHPHPKINNMLNLNFRGNSIKENGASKLAEAFSNLVDLQELNLNLE